MMRLLLGLALALVAGTAHAQFGPPIYVAPAATTTYLGPGDILTNARGYYGLRAFSAAKVGNDVMDIQRNSDSATCTHIKSSTSSGVVDVTVGTPCGGSTVTSFCNATTCTVTKLYEQTGATGTPGANIDMTQSTVSKQPVLTLSCIGSLPCLTMTASSLQFLLSATNGMSSLTQPYSVYGVAKRTGANTTTAAVCGLASTGSRIGFFSSTNTIYLSSATGTNLTLGSITDNVWHSIWGLSNTSTNSGIAADGGANTTGSAGTTGAGTSPEAAGRGGGTGLDTLTGTWEECGWFGTDQSSSFAALNTQIKAVWGY